MKSIGTACLDMIKKDDINNRPYVCYKHSMTFKNLAFFWVDIVLGNLLFKNKKKIILYIVHWKFLQCTFSKKYSKNYQKCDYVQIPTIIMGDFNYSLETLSEFVY